MLSQFPGDYPWKHLHVLILHLNISILDFGGREAATLAIPLHGVIGTNLLLGSPSVLIYSAIDARYPVLTIAAVKNEWACVDYLGVDGRYASFEQVHVLVLDIAEGGLSLARNNRAAAHSRLWKHQADASTLR